MASADLPDAKQLVICSPGNQRGSQPQTCLEIPQLSSYGHLSCNELVQQNAKAAGKALLSTDIL